MQHLDTARIVLLLVSPDFMKSDYCYSIEMKRALELHKCGKEGLGRSKSHMRSAIARANALLPMLSVVLHHPEEWVKNPLGKRLFMSWIELITSGRHSTKAYSDTLIL